MDVLATRPRLYEDAARAIRDYITEHQLQPGDMLPSERQIQQQLGISRPSVREALRILQHMGIVEARQGKGLFVKEVDLTPLIDAYVDSLWQVGAGFTHLLQVREVIECGAARIVASQCTELELAELAAVLVTMRQRIAAGESALVEDLRFHELLVELSHNPLLIRLYSAITPFLLAVRQRSVSDDLRPVDWAAHDWSHACAAHQAVYEALAAHDPTTVVALVEQHLADVRNDLQLHRQAGREQ